MKILLVFVIALSAFAQARNILLFTADDLHAGSLATYGSKVPDLTPNLDAFAKTGMTFKNAHVNAAICSPCRKIIATGLLGHNSGAYGFDPAKSGTPNLIDILKQAGYRAGILGKVAHSTPYSGVKWDFAFDQKDLGNGRSPTLYYGRSKAFLEQCKAENKPFYFMVNSHDPHRPYCYPDRLTKGAEMPSRVYTPEEVEVPGFVPDLPKVRTELAAYQNSTRRLDDTFGNVLQALDETGMADSTLVVFMTDNGIAIPFAKCNAYFHSTRTPFIFRLPGTIKPGHVDDSHFVSAVDLMPTFLDLLGVEGPAQQDGGCILPLLKGGSQPSRDHVYTQIDTKAGGDAVPMRAIQNKKYGYIYNPFSDGEHWYRNNNEGMTMAGMNLAAKADAAIADRVKLFRYRVPEELFDLENDPNCLHNLIDNPEYAVVLKDLRGRLVSAMKASKDPMLEAFHNRDNREKVDAVLVATYGPKKSKKKPGTRKTKKK